SLLASSSSALGITPRQGELPLTLVDMDEALYASWGRPCITPRDRLQELIRAVADQHPAVIIADVDLSCVDGGAAPASLEAYLRSYGASAPLVLVRGMHVDPGIAQQVRLDASPYDQAVAANPRISWGNAFYLTDQDGTVRRWRDWWEVCTENGTM